jgi:hypothetical protein
MGRSGGRQWGVSVAAYGEIPMAAVSNNWYTAAYSQGGYPWVYATRIE